jgi:hypothetical protein
VGAGEHLDGLGERRIAGDRPVVVPVGADQVGQHLGVAGVGLGPRQHVALPVAVHRLGVDGVDLVARGQQGAHPKPPVGLDADHDLCGIVCPLGQQAVQVGQALQALGQAPAGQAPAVFVMNLDVMVGLSPVVTDEEHRVSSLPCWRLLLELGRPADALMDQCSLARHPTSRQSSRRPAGARS